MKMIWILITGVFFLPGCKKDKDPGPREALVGYWKGTFLRDGGTKIDGLYILFRTGGTARVYDMNLETDTTADGVSRFESAVTVTGRTVVIKGAIYTFTGEINDRLYKIEGTYTNTLSHTGVFSVTK